MTRFRRVVRFVGGVDLVVPPSLGAKGVLSLLGLNSYGVFIAPLPFPTLNIYELKLSNRGHNSLCRNDLQDRDFF